MENEKNSNSLKRTASEPDDELVDGGEINELDASEYRVDPIQKHKLTTARWLAYSLIGILAGSFVIHYGVMTWLAFKGKTEALETMEHTFSAWLPVISGLAGAAVTYFFTRERNERN